jgi:hypothetical protein
MALSDSWRHGQSDSRKVGDSFENCSLCWHQHAIYPSAKSHEANPIASSKRGQGSMCSGIQRSDLSALALLAAGLNVERNRSRGTGVDQRRVSGKGAFYGCTIQLTGPCGR